GGGTEFEPNLPVGVSGGGSSTAAGRHGAADGAGGHHPRIRAYSRTVGAWRSDEKPHQALPLRAPPDGSPPLVLQVALDMRGGLRPRETLDQPERQVQSAGAPAPPHA